jgi:hypothetical protein
MVSPNKGLQKDADGDGDHDKDEKSRQDSGFRGSSLFRASLTLVSLCSEIRAILAIMIA